MNLYYLCCDFYTASILAYIYKEVWGTFSTHSMFKHMLIRQISFEANITLSNFINYFDAAVVKLSKKTFCDGKKIVKRDSNLRPTTYQFSKQF